MTDTRLFPINETEIEEVLMDDGRWHLVDSVYGENILSINFVRIGQKIEPWVYFYSGGKSIASPLCQIKGFRSTGDILGTAETETDEVS